MKGLFTVSIFGLVLGACASGDQQSMVTPSTPVDSRSTAQITGYVDDTTFMPLAGATVEVLDGPQAGTSATTDADGKFSLNAVTATATRFRAKKEGYQPEISASSLPLTFFLAVDRPSGDTATLTVNADPACADLPAEFRRRAYEATVKGNSFANPPNSSFFVNLSDASLDHYFHFVLVRVAGGVVTFDMSDNGIEEEVAPEAYLFVGGVASTRAQPGASSISASLTTGLIDYCVVQSEPEDAYPCTDQAITRVRCQSPNNRLTLTWH